MDNLPAKSISKSVLLATPFFLIMLAVLHATSELSYLFILNFISNVSGSSDVTFLPSTKPTVTYSEFNQDSIMNQYNLVSDTSLFKEFAIPLIEVEKVEQWASKHPIVEDVSGRWLMPTKVGRTDTILIVMNSTREIAMGIGQGVKLEQMSSSQVAVQQSLLGQLGLQLGDLLPVTLQPKNMLAGLKLFEKISEGSSDDQYNLDSISDLDPKYIAKQLYKNLDVEQADISEQDFTKVFMKLFETSVTVQFTIRQTFVGSGLYPSTLHNVVIMEKPGFSKLLTQWIIESVVQLNENEQEFDITDYIPEQYSMFWPTTKLQAKLYSSSINRELARLLDKWSLFVVSRVRHREQVYIPTHGDKYQQFMLAVEQIPGTTQVLVLYPFFKQSLAIKFYFDAVVQIFEFATCILFYFTVSLIMKNIYEEKEIQVGIWRTLGAGGLPTRKNAPQIQIQNAYAVRNQGNGAITYQSQFQSKQSFKDKLRSFRTVLIKVGYVYYWLTTVAISLLIYVVIKIILYNLVTATLHYDTIFQPLYLIPLLFVLVFGFIQCFSLLHIKHIQTQPLSQTIKPVKRTFDLVKVRVIHIATFGISVEMLLVAVMLIYYGVVSYYWIPFAVLSVDEDLQVFLLNSIFIFMIMGAIVLLSILQSKLQIAILYILFMLNSRLRNMKMAILKNIRAKQYKNIKVTIIISLIFAFVLFFTAGISAQIQIVQSFLERALGAELVLENYEDKTFNTSKVDEYLSKRQGIQYAWFSQDLDRDPYSISFVSHISGEEINAEFQVLTSHYMNSSFYQYYYPEQYLSSQAEDSYWTIPNGLHDGFNSIYTGQGGNESVGKFNSSDTIKDIDPKRININGPGHSTASTDSIIMAPDEQVIDVVVSTSLRKQMGVIVGDYFKMKLANRQINKQYYLRCRIVHSFKAGPGFDILREQAFISAQQAAYIYKVLGAPAQEINQNEKLLIGGKPQNLKGIGNSIVSMSPEHTQVFEIDFIRSSFSTIQKSLNGYVLGITVIMNCLAVVFLFLYTLSKCREEAEMYKMLRAIGVSCSDIRLMVFCEVMVRLFVAIANGILLGIAITIGFSMQIEEFMMFTTPPVNPTSVIILAAVLLVIFGITVLRATSYLSSRTVANTSSR